MSDALAAASMISGQLSYYRMMDGLRAACARRDYENELTYLQARNDWLTRNLMRVCDEYGKLVDTANGREAEYRRRIADLEQENDDLTAKVARAEAKYKGREAQAVQEADQNRDQYNRLVEDHNDVLRRYKTLLTSVSPEVLAGNPRLLVDYKVVQGSEFKSEGA
jgi:hypothetical protein